MAKTRVSDRVYKYATAALGGVSIFLLGVIVYVLWTYSYPSIAVNGISFFTTSIWNPNLNGVPIIVNGFKTLSGSSYGVIVFVYGTFVSSALALLIGVPAGLGTAIFLTQYSPKKISTVVSFLIEMLAGIPSVILGFWGVLVLGPALISVIEPFMATYLGFIPGFGGPVYNAGLIASGLILGLMIVPIIASISRDTIARTPIELKEAGKSLGMTNWEITRKIILPLAKTGIFGATILGLGRALGETMAVAMVSGGALYLPTNIYSSINTMAAFMASTLDGAFTDPTNMNVYALVEMAGLLLIITMIVNVVARAILRQGFFTSAESVVQV